MSADEIEDPLANLYRAVLKEIGEDPGRDGLVRTPSRTADALRFFTDAVWSVTKQRARGPTGEQ